MIRARYREIVESMAADIRSGVIPSGARMPTHRELARRYNLSIGTATRVYIELGQLGLVSGEVGRGTFARSPNLDQMNGLVQERDQANSIDLNLNYPIVDDQAELFSNTLDEISRRYDAFEFLRFQPHAGRNRDRAAGALWLSTPDRRISPEEVLVCAGGQHGLTVTLMALCRPGDRIAADAFTYPGFKVLAGMLQLELVPVPNDEHGMVPEELAAICRRQRITAVYCIPTIQNPLGSVMPLERRQKLLEVAVEHDLMIIEDDVYGFLEPSPPTALAALAPERCFTVNSMSKSIAPGLRVGFVVPPPRFAKRIETAIRATTWTTAVITAEIASRWIEDGTAMELVRRKRAEATERQKIAREALKAFRWSGHPGSFHIWLDLPKAWRTDDVLSVSRGYGVIVTPASAFIVGDAPPPQAIRLALGSPRARDDLRRGIETIADILVQEPKEHLATT